MLVLTRRVNEAIVFPELNITVRVVRIRNGRVQLGIDAPQTMQISRPDARRESVVPNPSSGYRGTMQLAAG